MSVWDHLGSVTLRRAPRAPGRGTFWVCRNQDGLLRLLSSNLEILSPQDLRLWMFSSFKFPEAMFLYCDSEVDAATGLELSVTYPNVVTH
jgi:hypothetical protein